MQRIGRIYYHSYMNKVQRYLLLILLLLGATGTAWSQTCTTIGQTPATAFPVCGVDTFSQSTVPLCGGTPIPGPCASSGITDINPFWYKFTCFTPGTLGFIVDPIDRNDDYDWQLFDITGKNPNDVFTDASLFVACNWSGLTGITGASSVGTDLINCGGTSYPLFSKMPTLIKDHEYLLLLSNFSSSQKGYKLAFVGGTASITDPEIPAYAGIMASCDGTKVGVKLNKKMKCNSLASDGSDFTLNIPGYNFTNAVGVGCNISFDMDSVVLTTNTALMPGNYNIIAQKGTDGNTLLDNCKLPFAEGYYTNFIMYPSAPTPMDSMVPIKCEPKQIELVFKQNIRCSSVAADGSDFLITGPSAVTISGATASCGAGTFSTRIVVSLANAIQKGGQYTIQLKTGSDGNTLLNECNYLSPAGSINFTATDTVGPDYNFQIGFGCTEDTVQLTHPGGNGISSWNWFSDGVFFSNQQNPTITYKQFGPKSIKLRVTNDVCTDSSTQIVDLNNALNAAFTVPTLLCPEDQITIVNQSSGNIRRWDWQLGDGRTSNLKDPPVYTLAAPTNARERNYTIRLIATNDHNCLDTAIQVVKMVNTCRIAIPNAFTPNADGKNDFLYPLNAFKADNLIFRVYNRYGQVVFETKDWTKKWDGSMSGKAQPAGTYVWILQYIDRDSGTAVLKKGTTVLIR